MIKSIIRYVGLTIVIIGIVILMSNLFTKGDSSFNSNDKNSGIKYYTASIRVLDEDTKKFISGGEFVLKKDNGKVIEEWNGTENIHRVNKLSAGTYILEQRSVADGYEKADNITFKIINSDKDIVMYNSVLKEEEKMTSNEINVDNTLSLKNCFSNIIAILIISGGFGLIFLQKRCYNN